MATGGAISYSVHIRNRGWQHDPPGTIGLGLPIEALNFNIKAGSGVTLCLRAHVQNIGWQGWQCASAGGVDRTVGTTGLGLQMEALQIQSPTHQIEAFGHQAVVGNLRAIRTARAGHVITLGSTGQSRGLEYIDLKSLGRY